MPTIHDIIGNSAKVSIPFGSESLNIEYRPDSVSQETLIKLQKFAGTTDLVSVQDQFNELDQVIIDLIASWDLLENDGVTVIPLTVERLLKLPVRIIGVVIEGIMGDMTPNSGAA
jgi:hypothetical protein